MPNVQLYESGPHENISHSHVVRWKISACVQCLHIPMFAFKSTVHPGASPYEITESQVLKCNDRMWKIHISIKNLLL